MDPIVAIGTLLFVGAFVALYFTRHKLAPKGAIALALAGALAGGGVVWRASVIHDRTEPTFMADAITWNRVPVTVYVDPSGLTTYMPAIHRAAETWNSRLGYEALRFVDTGVGADVTIRAYVGQDCPSGTDVSPTALADACIGYNSVDISLRRLDDVGLAFRVVLHELGHALGLAHDPDGAMAVTAVEPQPGDYPEALLPSNVDIAALRARYPVH